MAPEPTPVLCSLGSDLGLFSRASLERVPPHPGQLSSCMCFWGIDFFTQLYLSIRSHLLCVLGVREMFWIAAGTFHVCYRFILLHLCTVISMGFGREER